ncbi:MAG: response regulator transcription factor [Cyanobacteriota bacterium]|nr:response regulator transcription factor [Cyanobacteriota bacterium]
MTHALDGVADRAVLEARRDLLLCLLRDQQVLMAVYPRFLALSLAFRTGGGDGSPLKTLVFATSTAEGLARLDQTPGPFHLLVSEYLSDGPGLDLIRAAKARSPLHRCLLVLTHNRRVLVQAALECGADALVLEESLGRTGALVLAVEQVAKGLTFVDPALDQEPPEQPAEDPVQLTPRELTVLQLVAHGLSNREIGAQLHIAPTTARDHVQDILRRLGVRSRAAAAVEGVRRGYCR